MGDVYCNLMIGFCFHEARLLPLSNLSCFNHHKLAVTFSRTLCVYCLKQIETYRVYAFARAFGMR